MRIVMVILVLATAAPVVAQNLGVAPPPREFEPAVVTPTALEGLRQGGDTWEEAVPIPGVPFLTTGTTVGYSVNCCLEMCPYEAWGPAVFYSFTPDQDIAVRVDLCGSSYDTGLYIFDEVHSVVACNIDYYFGPPCGLYVSCIERAVLEAGQFYTIVVTGMSGASGDYILEMTEFEECVVDVPAGAVPEGEPALVEGYLDSYNGGCNSPEFGSPFQELIGDAQGHLLFAGVSGWYLSDQGQNYRDTDWFWAVIGETGVIDVTLLAEADSYLFELAPLDCASVAVAQQATSDDCEEASLQVTGEPGSVVWLWVGPTTFSAPDYPPGNEYDYLLTLEGLQPGPVAGERTSWSAVRALYR